MALPYRVAYRYNDLGRHPSVNQHDSVFGASLLGDFIYLFVTHLQSTTRRTWVRKYNLAGGDPVESILLDTSLTDWVDGTAFDVAGTVYYLLAREVSVGRVPRIYMQFATFRGADRGGDDISIHGTGTSQRSSSNVFVLSARNYVNPQVRGVEVQFVQRFTFTNPIFYRAHLWILFSTAPAGINHTARLFWLHMPLLGSPAVPFAQGVSQFGRNFGSQDDTLLQTYPLTSVLDGQPKHIGHGASSFHILETASSEHVFSAIQNFSSVFNAIDSQDVNVQGQIGGGRSINALAAEEIRVGDSNVSRVVLVDHGRSTSEDEPEHGGHFHFYGIEGTEPPPPPNVPPRITTSVTTYNLPLNVRSGVTVATFTGVDPDAEPDDTLTWSLTGTDAASFALNSSTGVLTTAAALTNGTTYNLTINLSDGQDTTTLDIMVSVATNVAPVISTTQTTYELQFNIPRNTLVVDLQASDANEGDTLTWQIYDTHSGLFSIESGTGAVRTAAPLRVAGDLRFVARVTDEGGLWDEIALTVTILPEGANVAPRFTTTTTTYSLFRPSVRDIVARLTAVDDNNHALTFSLSGTHASNFNIGAGTGIITVARALTRGQSYTFSAVVTDTENAFATLNIRVNVIDNRPPTFTTRVTSYQVISTSPLNTYITRIVATDVDGDALTYTLGGTGASSFALNSSTGDLTTAGALQAGTTYALTINVSDGTTTASLQLTVTAVAQPTPVAPTFPTVPVGAGEPQIDGLHEFREVFDMVSPGMGDTISRIRQTNFQAIRQTALSLGTRISGEFTLQERLNEVEIIPIYPLENVRIGDVLYVRQPQGDLSVGDLLPTEHFQIIGVASVGDNKRQALVCTGFP